MDGLEQCVYPRDRNGQGICALRDAKTKALRWEKASWCHPGVKFMETVEVAEIKQKEVRQGEKFGFQPDSQKHR